MLNLTEQRHLNEIGRSILVEAGVNWFRSLDDKTKTAVLIDLVMFALQAGARPSDAEPAIARSGLKPTFTPCVLLKRSPLSSSLAKIRQLPPNEQEKSFRLLVALYRIADDRRRSTRCAGGCSHWWHEGD
jgi:hypothetical protein